MREGHLIFTSLWGKRAVLLVSWALFVLALIIFAAHNDLNKLYRNTQSWKPELRLPRNQMGAFSYRRYSSKETGSPVHSASFENLLVENNNFGFFKTALHKMVKIQHLKLAFYRYPTAEAASNTEFNSENAAATITGDASGYSVTPAADTLTVPKNAFTPLENLVNDIDNLIKPSDGWRLDIDLSNVSEVLVANFDYKVFYDGTLLLSVQSKRATISNKSPDEVMLRGHVIVKAEDGSVLESNCVKWDVRKHHFIADGTYFLTHNGNKIHGKSICVDDRLNNVQTQITAIEKRRKENG